MDPMDGAITRSRFLIAAGTEQYKYLPDLAPLRSVPADLERVERLFCARLGYQRVRPDLALNPGANELRQGISGWLNAHERTEDDVLVIYYSGHAIVSGRHYLLCHDSREDELAGSAVPTEDLMWVVGRNSPIRHILVILDTCYAGDGVRDMGQIAARVGRDRPGLTEGPSGLWFLAAARPQEEALESVFTEALATVVSSLRAGSLHRFLSLDSVVSGINTAFKQRGLRQRAYLGAQDVITLPPFVDNPDYDPQAKAGLDLDSRRRQAAAWQEDLYSHWGPRSRGVPLATDPGLYFSGRVQALSELVAWLSDPDTDSRPRIVTGDPGSGKSAVLARIVMLSDADGRAQVIDQEIPPGTLPPQGIVDVAVNARNRTEAQVLQMLADGLAVQAASTPSLIAALSDRPRRRVAVIDSIDEASSPPDLTNKVLRPLADASATTGVRLLLGMRRRAARAFEGRKVLIDLDDPRYLGVDDLAGYVRQILLAENELAVRTPYRKRPGHADTVAKAVAARASPVFLIARIVARSLLASEDMVDLAEPGWSERFPSTVGHAFDGYLERCGVHEEVVRAVLTPLAWAEGSGLPWEQLWAPLARALYPGRDITDADIERVHRIAGEYIVESRAWDRSVYRLYHHALAEHLRGDPGSRHGLEIQERFSRTLVDLTPTHADGRRDWFGAHPYIRTHLPTHARRTSLLNSLVPDAEFLLATDPDRLLPALTARAWATQRVIVAIYKECVHQLRDGPPALAAAYLELAARKHEENAFADAAGMVCGPLPWRTRWAHWQHGRSSRLLGRCEARITAMTLASLHGQVAVIAGDEKGTLYAFDLARGRSIGQMVRAHESSVGALAAVNAGGQSLVVSGGTDGLLRVFALTTRGLLSPAPYPAASTSTGLRRGKRRPAVSSLMACEVDGSPVVVSGERDGAIRFWALTGTALDVRHTARASRSQINALAFARPDGQPVAVSADADGSIRMWDMSRGRLIREHATGSSGGLNAVAVAGEGSDSLIITGGADGLVQVWDLGLAGIGSPLAGHRLGVHALAVTADRKETAIVSGGADETLHAWRRSGSTWLAGRPVGHRHGVRALAVAESGGGQAVVLSAGGDSRVRAWELSDLMFRDVSSGTAGRAVRAVAVTTVRNQPVVVAASEDGIVTAFDAGSGAVLGQAPERHRLAVRALAVAAGGSSPLVASVGDDETMRLWEFGAAASVTVVTSTVLNCVVIIPELAVLVAGGDDGRIRLYRATDGAPAGREQHMHDGRITALAAVSLGGRAAFVSGGADGQLRLHFLGSDSQTLHLAEQGCPVQALCTTGRDYGVAIAAGGNDGMVRLWGLPGERLELESKVLAGRHQGTVTAVAAMGGTAGTSIISGGQDSTVWIRTPDEAHLIETGSPVTSIAALGDGVIVGTESGLLLLGFSQ
jgi:WD40 repeat protein